MPEASDPQSPMPPARKRFTWLTRALAFLLSPKILLGGILAYAATQGYEAYKTYKAESHDDTKEVRTAIQKLILPLPTSSAKTAELIANVQVLAVQYESTAAKAVVARTVDDLSDRQSRQARLESDEQLVAEATRRVTDAKRHAEEALKTEAAARAQDELRKAEEAKNAAVRQAAEVAEQTRRQDQLIRDRLKRPADLSNALAGFSCSVNSYGGAWAEGNRHRVSNDLYRDYGCSAPAGAHSPPGYRGDFHTSSASSGPWGGFSARSTVLYYHSDNKSIADAVARDLSQRYGHRFVAAKGGGQGVLREWYHRTIIVHLREEG